MTSINRLSQLAVSQMTPAIPPPAAGTPSRIRDAAQQFEGLLLAQILHSAHEEGSGWLGSGGDASGSCAGDYAEEQLAACMAKNGGFGLAKLIASGLK
jgi:Rod binding domain-containing protein